MFSRFIKQIQRALDVKNQNFSESGESRNSKGKVKWVEVAALIVSAIALAVSVWTYYDNKMYTDKYRRENEQYTRLEASKSLEINTNIEYWDYSISIFIEDLISKHGLTEQLWEIALLNSNKQSGTALELMDEIEPLYYNDGTYYLLKCYIILRDYIVKEEYNNHSFVGPNELSEYCLKAIENGVDTEKYCISLGIVEYYVGEYVRAVEHLEYAIKVYDSDSPFYDISNFWLTLISIKVRSCLCDSLTFLNSDFNEGSIINVMKSSLVFLFDVGENYSYPSSYLSIYRNNRGKKEHIRLLYYASVHLRNNPAKYLNPDNTNELFGYSSYSERYLYGLYNMLYEYSKKIQSVNEYEICPPEHLDETNKELVTIVSQYNEKYGDYPETWLLDPRNINTDSNLLNWRFLENYRMYEGDAYFTMIPFDVILDKVIALSNIRTTEDMGNYNEYLTYMFSESASRFDPDSDHVFNEFYAILALKYYPFRKDAITFNKADAAMCAYRAGYRYDFVYDALIEYYTQIGDEQKINKLNQEISVLEFRYYSTSSLLYEIQE